MCAGTGSRNKVFSSEDGWLQPVLGFKHRKHTESHSSQAVLQHSETLTAYGLCGCCDLVFCERCYAAASSLIWGIFYSF